MCIWHNNGQEDIHLGWITWLPLWPRVQQRVPEQEDFVDRIVWNTDVSGTASPICVEPDRRRAFSRNKSTEKSPFWPERTRFLPFVELTKSKSRASSRIRSFSNDERSAVCFQRGNEDLNSGRETTPGHISSDGVPSVLTNVDVGVLPKRFLSMHLPENTKELIDFWITLKQRSFREHFGEDATNGPNIDLRRKTNRSTIQSAHQEMIDVSPGHE